MHNHSKFHLFYPHNQAQNLWDSIMKFLILVVIAGITNGNLLIPTGSVREINETCYRNCLTGSDPMTECAVKSVVIDRCQDACNCTLQKGSRVNVTTSVVCPFDAEPGECTATLTASYMGTPVYSNPMTVDQQIYKDQETPIAFGGDIDNNAWSGKYVLTATLANAGGQESVCRGMNVTII